MLIKTEDDVLDAFKEIRKGWGTPRNEDLRAIDAEFGKIKYKVLNNIAVNINWSYFFKDLCCRMVDIVNENPPGFNGESLAELLIDKHTKYGAEALTEWWGLGIAIRISSKLKRAINLKTTEEYIDPNDLEETFQDTLNDIIGYCILGTKRKESIVNIDDIKNVDLPEDGNVIKAIFEKQEILMAKYEPMEEKNGAIVPHRPWKIDDKFVQMRLKDMFWRFTEEICEALEFDHLLNFDNWKKRWEEDHQIRHFFEEMVDALHFLTEASIIANLDIEYLEHRYKAIMSTYPNFTAEEITTESIREHCMAIIGEMGLAANTLKNKPWKNTHMSTDENKFKQLLQNTWNEYLTLMADLGMGPKELYILYVKKNEVNKFRQRSNY